MGHGATARGVKSEVVTIDGWAISTEGLPGAPPTSNRGASPTVPGLFAPYRWAMEARDSELEKELNATLQARSELGPEYESALIDSFLEKVDRRLDETLDRRVRRHLAEQQITVARGARAPQEPMANFGERFGFGIISLVLAIPLSAIGVANAGIEGLVVAWLGIVGVNVAQVVRGRPSSRRPEGRTKSDWED